MTAAVPCPSCDAETEACGSGRRCPECDTVFTVDADGTVSHVAGRGSDPTYIATGDARNAGPDLRSVVIGNASFTADTDARLDEDGGDA